MTQIDGEENDSKCEIVRREVFDRPPLDVMPNTRIYSNCTIMSQL